MMLPLQDAAGGGDHLGVRRGDEVVVCCGGDPERSVLSRLLKARHGDQAAGAGIGGVWDQWGYHLR